MKEKELVDYGCRFLEYREAVRPMLKETKEILGEEYKLPKKYTNLVDRYNRLSDQLEEVEDQLNAYSRVQLQKLIEKCNEHLPEGFEVVHGYSSWYDGRGGFWARIADVRPEEVQRLERRKKDLEEAAKDYLRAKGEPVPEGEVHVQIHKT